MERRRAYLTYVSQSTTTPFYQFWFIRCERIDGMDTWPLVPVLLDSVAGVLDQPLRFTRCHSSDQTNPGVYPLLLSCGIVRIVGSQVGWERATRTTVYTGVMSHLVLHSGNLRQGRRLRVRVDVTVTLPTAPILWFQGV